MSINNLGFYELPLTDEEFNSALPEVIDDLKKDLRDQVIHYLYNESVRILNRAYTGFGSTGNGSSYEVRDNWIKENYQKSLDVLEEKFPLIEEFRNKDNIQFILETDEQGMLSLYAQGWLDKYIVNETSCTISNTALTHSKVVGIINKKLRSNSELRKRNLSEEQVKIFEFNEKLNELNDEWVTVDYTAVISEIIEAAKKGEL